MNNDKVLRLIGLCRRSGNCACGATAVEYAVKSGRAKLLIITEDCGEATRKKFLNYANGLVNHIIMFDKTMLGSAVGYKNLSLIAITDENFADGICKCVKDMEEI